MHRTATTHDQSQPKHLDEHAFVALYEAHYAELLRYAERLLGDSTKAKDAVQEAFLRLWKRKAMVAVSASTRAMLYKAVRNLILNHKRDAQRHHALLKTMPSDATTPSPEADIDTAWLGEQIAGWIHALPQRRREAFELSRFHGLRYDEIAVIMGVTSKTVENHIVLALKHIRQKLHALDPQLLKP